MEYQEKSTQHSVITYMGKDPKMNRQVYRYNAPSSVHLEQTHFYQICSDKTYILNLKIKQEIRRYKHLGVCPGTFHSNWQPTNTISRKALLPKYPELEMQKCCRLVAVSRISGFKPTANGHLIFTRTQGCKGHLPSKNILRQVMAQKIQNRANFSRR